MDRFTEFALGAGKLAVDDAKLELTDEERDEAGCFIGVGLGGLWTLEKTKATLIEKGPAQGQPVRDPRHHREPRRGAGLDGARPARAELLHDQRVLERRARDR